MGKHGQSAEDHRGHEGTARRPEERNTFLGTWWCNSWVHDRPPKRSTGGPSHADEVEGERKSTLGGVVVRSTWTRRFACAIGTQRGVVVHDGRSPTRPQMRSVRAALPRHQQERHAPLVQHATLWKSIESCGLCGSPTQAQINQAPGGFSSPYGVGENTATASRHIRFLLREVPGPRAADYDAFLHAGQSDQAQLFAPDRAATAPQPPGATSETLRSPRA